LLLPSLSQAWLLCACECVRLCGQAIGADVCVEKQGSPSPHYSLLVAQNGSHLPCGEEFDVFLAPTDSAYNNLPSLNLAVTNVRCVTV
jgi:hypothetical protein